MPARPRPALILERSPLAASFVLERLQDCESLRLKLLQALAVFGD
jgi:hypothetical protein